MLLLASDIWKENVYNKKRRTVAEVKYTLVAPEVKKKASVSLVPPSTSFSRPDQLLNDVADMSAKIATFEPNYWQLDGTYVLPQLPEESNMEVGFWSDEITDHRNEFEIPLVLEITFSEVQNINAYGITFDSASGNFCTDFRVLAYNVSLRLIFSEFVEGNTGYYGSTKGGSVDTYKVIYEFYRTNKPYRRLRIAEFDFGVVIRFTNKEIFDLKLINEADLSGKTYPLPQLNLTAHNDGNFDRFDQNSYAYYIYARQNFEYRHGLVLPDNTVEWVHMGTYFLKEWKISDKELKFTCTGKSSWIENVFFYDSTFEKQSVGAVIAKTLGILNLDLNISPILNESPDVFCFLGNVDYRSAVAILSELSCCLVYEDRENVIQFRDILPTQIATDKIDYSNMYEPPETVQGQYYNGINLIEYSMSVESGQQLGSFEIVNTGSNSITVHFDAPAHGIPSYSVTEGFVLTNIVLRTMYMTAILTGNGTAEIVITGNRVTLTPQEVFYRADWHNILEPDYPYVIDLPMMIRGDGFEEFRSWFLARRFELLKKRLTSEPKWRQNPEQQIGDTVNITTNNKMDTLDMLAIRQEISYNSGALSGNTKVIARALVPHWNYWLDGRWQLGELPFVSLR